MHPFRLFALAAEGEAACARLHRSINQGTKHSSAASKPTHHTPLLPPVCMAEGRRGEGRQRHSQPSRIQRASLVSGRLASTLHWCRCILSSLAVCVCIGWLPSAQLRASVRQRCPPHWQSTSEIRRLHLPVATVRSSVPLLAQPDSDWGTNDASSRRDRGSLEPRKLDWSTKRRICAGGRVSRIALLCGAKSIPTAPAPSSSHRQANSGGEQAIAASS